MLVLSRRAGEKIIINEELVITINHIDSRSGQVKIAFEAPREDYLIDRYEVYLSKQAEDAAKVKTVMDRFSDLIKQMKNL